MVLRGWLENWSKGRSVARRGGISRRRGVGGSEVLEERRLLTNVAPVLNDSGAPTLNGITLNVSDAENTGTSIEDLIANMGPSGGISDADSGALQGIAINGLSGTATGTWQYTVNGGSSWSSIGTTGNSDARLLAADGSTRIRYVPNTGFLGQAKIAFVAWDQTTGVNGGVTSVASRGGTKAFSLAYEYASVTVTNTAPVLNNAGSPTLGTISTNIPDGLNNGTSIEDLIASMGPSGGISDANPGTNLGIAINGMSGDGTWQYTINGGSNWSSIGATGNFDARLLAADGNTRIRFVPNAGFQGEAKIAFVAWDQTTGTNGGNAVVASRGGTKAFSLAYEHASIFVTNAAPELDDAGAPVLDSIGANIPDASNTGTSIEDLIASMGPSGGISDTDTGAVQGIAVNGLTGTGNGTWQYTVNGGTNWTPIAVTGDTDALLLAADGNTRIRFVPNSGFTGTATVSFAGWDRTSGANGGTADVTTRGGSTAFSLDSETASIDVLGSDLELSQSVSAPSPGLGSTVTFTVTLTNNGNGSASNVQVANAIPAGLDGVTFNPSSGTYSSGVWSIAGLGAGESVTLTISGTVGATGSNITNIAEVTANDTSDTDSTPNNGVTTEDDYTTSTVHTNYAPTLTASGTSYVSYNAVPAANGSLVSTLISRMSPSGSITDSDAGAVQGIAIYASTANNGYWQYTTNGTTWTNLGSVSSGSSRLLAADANTKLRFVFTGPGGGSGTLSFHAWDQTAGTNGGTYSTATRGGATPFSQNGDSATVSTVIS